MLNKIKKMDTVAHRVTDYNQDTNMLIGMIVFRDSMDIKKYVKWLAYYVYEIIKVYFDGQKLYSETMYDLIFDFIYDKIRVENVYQNEETQEYVLEYDINLTGMNDLKNAIRHLEENMAQKDRQLIYSKEEKEAESTVIDMFRVFQFIKDEKSRNDNSVYMERLARMISGV